MEKRRERKQYMGKYNRKYYEQNKEKIKKRVAEWTKDNPEKRKRYRRKSHLKKLYGITLEEYENMLSDQGGVCKICKGRDAKELDHCHSTGKVRGILCKFCNMMLGAAKDNRETLRSAVEYLAEHQN